MKKHRNIAVYAIFAIVCVWMVGCGGCNPEPMPTDMSPIKGASRWWNHCSYYWRKI